MPLLFGAVHPITEGFYYSVMLLAFGGWLLLNSDATSSHISFWLLVPVLLIGYLVLQAIPLPFSWVELLSPARAQRMHMVKELTGAAIGAIPLGDQANAGFYRAICFSALLFYYISLRHLFDTDAKIYMGVLYVIAGLGAFEAFYGLLQFAKPHLGTLWLKSFGRGAHGTIIYKNQFASLMNMIWPVIFATGVIPFLRRKNSPQPKKRKASSLINLFSHVNFQGPLFILLAGFMVLATIFSLSRGGILSFLFTAVLLALFLPFSLRAKTVFFTVFLGLIFSYGAVLGWETILSRFSSIGGTTSIRMSIYLSSLQMAIDHWLTGIGLDSYELLSAVYIKWLPVNALADRVHCEYLELLIELGIPMASLLFLWIFWGMYKIFRNLRTRRDKTAAVIGIAAWCGLASFLVHGIIDFGWRLPVNLFYAVTLLALATGNNALKLDRKRKKRKIRKSATDNPLIFQ